MQFQKDNLDHPIYIKSYDQDNSEIKLLDKNYNKEQVINTSLIVLFDKIIPNWEPKKANNITSKNILDIISHNPEIIILGIGDKVVQLDYSVLEPLYQKKIPFEIMSTVHACRTYNLLASEHRKVLAALIL